MEESLYKALMSCVIMSVISFAGALILPLLNIKRLQCVVSSSCLTLAAAVMAADALIHLIPHSLEECNTHEAMAGAGIASFAGALGMIIFEQFCHGLLPHDSQLKASGLANLLCEMIHNFIDGIAIAVSWSSGRGAGLATTWAVAAHELPQELGDFVVLSNAGMSPATVLVWNFIASLTSFGGVLVGHYYVHHFPYVHSILLAATAGSFLSVSLNMIAPEIFASINAADTLAHRVFVRFACLLVCLFSVWCMIKVGDMEEDAHIFHVHFHNEHHATTSEINDPQNHQRHSANLNIHKAEL